MFFPDDKEILKQFLLPCTSICMSSRIVSQIFKISFQTVDIIIFVLHRVFFSKCFQLKSSLSDKKKTSTVKSETHFWREAIKLLNKNSIICRSWRSSNLFIIQNYTDNANGDVPFTVEIV